MKTRVCDEFGIDLPIFAFSHCRDVVAAVSKAGGFGVLGALAFSPDQLEIELNWIDEHVDGKPYGVDVVMPAKYEGAGIVNEPGTFSWAELLTTDTDAAKTFYAAVFGWGEETHAGAGPGGAYTEWKLGGRSISGMMVKPAEMPAEVPPHWNVYFAVEDTDKAVEQIKTLGGGLVMGPMDIEPGRFAVVGDDQDAHFNIITLR